MSVTHATPARNTMADTVLALLNSGGAGILEFQTSDSIKVAAVTFGNPAFMAASNGVSIANPITPESGAIGGTIAKAVLKSGAGNPIIYCSVTSGGGGGDIELSNVNVNPGQSISISSLSYTAAI